MKLSSKFSRLFALSLAVIMLFAVMVGVAGASDNGVSGNGIVPVYYGAEDFKGGNPSCVDLGYTYGIKWNYPEDSTGGTYTLGLGTVTWSTDGTYVDWSSTFGVDAVLVKGGPATHEYVYNPESFGDTDLVSPNTASGGPAGLSHVEFCYDYEVTVEKTATTTFTRTFTWDIDKSVTPDTLDMFTGDSGDVEYTITLDKTVTDSDWAVSGTITIANPDPTFTATITSVTDSISGFGIVAVTCPVALPADLLPGEELVCSYKSPLPNGNNRINTATVTTTGKVGGGSDTADVKFGEPTTIVGYDTINVDDTNGKSWQFSADGSVSYKKTFACNEDAGQNDNTATIRETGQFDDATVNVNCYKLNVTKDAHTSFTRTYNWNIDKVGDQSALTLSTGQAFLVNYAVTVSATYTDSKWAVDGNIWVKNPAPMAATLNGVKDVISGVAEEADVDCGVSFPYKLPAGATLACTYNAALPNASARLNTATATLQNTPAGTTDFSGTADVKFGEATISEVDECIDVTDDKFGALGKVCYKDLPKTFKYSLYVGPYAECGDYAYDNTAAFVTNDSGKTGSDKWTVNVHVPCATCTLTQGYWKTHSDRGPARYDDAWKNLGALEEDTLFFNSGKTWYQVFWTAPAGNAYYNLAHQYMAAKLNILNGSSAPLNVQTAMAAAEALFNIQGVNDVTLNKTETKLALSLAALLDNYNNGLIGPGHCSE